MASPTITVGNEFRVHNAAGNAIWRIPFQTDGNIDLVRLNSSGVDQETVLSINGTTGAITASVNTTRPFRQVAADAALTWTTDDANGTIELANSAVASAKAATVVTTGFLTGQTLTFYLLARSVGSYTIAASGLTVTLDAAGEGCTIVFNGTAWRIAALTGGATAA